MDDKNKNDSRNFGQQGQDRGQENQFNSPSPDKDRKAEHGNRSKESDMDLTDDDLEDDAL